MGRRAGAPILGDNVAVYVRPRRRPSFVYYAERDGHIKIGKSVVPVKRVRDLSRGGCVMPPGVALGPLVLLATEPGDERLEMSRHHQFAHLHTAGEWFRAGPELLDHIGGLT